MLTTPTLDKLHELNLMGMARAFQEQLERADYQALSFDERLGLLVDREAQDRENRRMDRHLKAARLRDNACIEDLNFHRPRGLDRALMLGLADAQWVDGHRNVLIIGATGLGKTYIACALAHAAIRRGHTALYLRAPRILGDLAVARVDGRMPRLLTSWTKVDVLVIDDLALQPLTNQQAADLLEVIEDRSQRRSTIVTSQLPVSDWHHALGEPTVAEAILDRLVHNAHRIHLRGGRSLRGSEEGDDGLVSIGEDGRPAADERENGATPEKRRARKEAVDAR